MAGVVVNAVGWLVLGGVVWCVASVALAVVIGKAAVRRERQKPVAPPVLVQRCEALLPPPHLVNKLRESVRHNPPAGPRKGEQ